MNITPETILSILLGIGLAASVGFRVFLPLFALSLASFFDVIPLNENWNWIGDSTALIILGIATFVEILAYLIPWIDNMLDVIALPLAAHGNFATSYFLLCFFASSSVASAESCSLPSLSVQSQPHPVQRGQLPQLPFFIC